MYILSVCLMMFSFIAQIGLGDKPFVHASPKVIVYKTKKNYNKYVPVILSIDKKSIVVYPAPQDVYRDGKLAYPTKLAKGYLLDNRGLNIHSAFLDITYKQYSKMKDIDPKELMKHIKSFDPLISFYTCGERKSYVHIVQELNAKITSGKLGECDCLVKP